MPYLFVGWQVAQLSKFKEGGGLGISLEGTVDMENGQEVRPHHYIGSIRPDGPVGLNGRLKTNDELLEVTRWLINFNILLFIGRNLDLGAMLFFLGWGQKVPEL